jgi:hypothetical protein
MLHSKELRQQVMLVLDLFYGQSRPFAISEVAEQAERETRTRWSQADLAAAKNLLLNKEIKSLMKAPPERLDLKSTIGGHVPEEVAKILTDLPSAICVSIKPALWIGIEDATSKDWAANAALKKRISDKVLLAAADPQEISDLLESKKAKNIPDLMAKYK